ncbi:hypothetical protein ABT56_18455 [Photobacterium aquae]|uniref:Tetratricopeptide repeat protein n=1 Tax=Photobacterium aquae TaxID=1195763 RepID=A0A0J1GVV9_9GAMM|nr:tetratricopeptide repeat protein [Photobacterium aquae]KLV03584.1 hypothetical protein ABT56_18455 [Photobacterium aquae]
MKLSLLPLLLAAPVLANEQGHVQLLESQVSVKINPPQTYSGYDESPIWEILEKEGWQAAQQAASSQNISDNLNGEISYQAALSQLNQAVESRNTPQARALLASNPQWSNCERIQWAWLDLQFETQSGYGPKAKQKLTALLQNCPQHALATTQKTLAWTQSRHGTDILARYRNSSGFDSNAYSKLTYQVNLNQLGKRRLSSQQTQQASQQISTIKDAKGAELLGWQYLRQKQPAKALSWFNQSINWSSQPSRKQIEGKILSLQRMGQTDDAEQLKSKWSKRYPALTKLNQSQGSPALAKACKNDPQSCLKLLDKLPSLTPQQQALAGWQWYKLDRPMTATRAFVKALKTLPKNDKDYTNTQYGYTLALNKAGFEQRAEYLAYNLPDPSQRMLYTKQREAKAILNAYELQDYAYVIDKTNQFEMNYGKDVGMAEIKGWAYYNQKQTTKAVETFRELADAYPHDETFSDALKTAECAQKKSYKHCW